MYYFFQKNNIVTLQSRPTNQGLCYRSGKLPFRSM